MDAPTMAILNAACWSLFVMLRPWVKEGQFEFQHSRAPFMLDSWMEPPFSLRDPAFCSVQKQ